MSRWYKTDLQIASPAGGFSMEHGDISTAPARDRAVSTYVQHIKDAGIEVFAVMDHNATSMLEEIRDEARKQGLVMFPGMELSTGTGADGVHLLLLGDPDADIAKLTYDWLAAAAFDPDHPAFSEAGEHMPSKRSIFDILKNLPEDTIAIAPHILAENGIASGDSIKEKTIKWRALHNDRLEAVDPGQPSGKGGWNDQFRARELDNFPALKRLSFVSTSDAYKPADLGRFTWIRMHQPDLASLRQAFLDHGARVMCDWDPRGQGDPNRITHAHIRSIRLDGMSTSTEPLEVEFDPRITVIIGSRGSGKSTIIQGLRAIYGGDASLPIAVEEETNRYQSQVFESATITSEFVEGISGEEDTATWTFDEGTQSQNSLINVRVVSQKELFERTSGDRVGGESSSANMLALVDEALNDDKVVAELRELDVDLASARVGNFQDDLNDLSRDYAQRASARLEAERKLAGRKKIQDGLAEIKRKLKALDNKDDKKKLEDAQATLDDKRKVLAYANDILSWVEEALDGNPLPNLPTISTAHAAKVFDSLKTLSARAASKSDELAEDIGKVVKAAKDSLADEKNEFAKQVEAAKTVKAEYTEKLKKLGVDISQYEALQSQKSEYEQDLDDLDETEKELPELRREEGESWARLEQLHMQRLGVREAFTSLVSGRTPSLKFAIKANADYASWKRDVHTALGFRQGDHVDALESLGSWLWSQDLGSNTRLERHRAWRDALLANDYGPLGDAHLTAGFIGRLKQNSEAVRIELATVFADDAFDMRFLRQGGKASDAAAWQTVTDGSPGQRSAAMLAFTLSYGDSPLILDQPEDDLDSALVSELIVTQFRDARWKRQLIVVTHEANIPVNTDAERSVVLQSSAGTLRVMKVGKVGVCGPIDDPLVREQIQDLLEGGVIAFVNRERRYDNELSKYRREVGLMSAKRREEDASE